MKTLHFAAVFVILLTLSGIITCYADINMNLGSQCSVDDKSTAENEFQINRRNLLDSLAANGPFQNGFYKTQTGEKSVKVYGLVQCRGDISANDCGNCINNMTKEALNSCPKSKSVWIWFRWCFLRYSNASFFGSMELSSGAWSNETNFDDPSMGSKGLDFMGRLASNASKQPLKFQTSVLDVGRGKRYGMAQCTRDINQDECHKCLNNQLVTFKEIIGNKRGWETHGSNCFMWYNYHHFYFNISTPASEGGRPSSHKGAAIAPVAAVLALLMVL
ncbi:cysteine-rich repeat secretory protein 38 [Ziziphus jujuba]|uniref:Cysteine-rich repeat secretory protein 38-like n=2 Tax=Ziziphus jujuba TaxID=326968 RepID=A0A6P6G174_ZIZJJ|nr:cysteine-rich repeat secretory protein 38 [Ziziphus jujuba]XP_024927893.1 cysteine-rich repeat secretory protein 38 [Ziziphus jujuba]XP_024927897.1 cysteine-rich repeat secretory protein 38 [Ziziphus jujuba]KAH7545830.1 hypothetical protein FEM48_Zijuj01G0135400 [Ziziphus jujuba var. spinosa]